MDNKNYLRDDIKFSAEQFAKNFDNPNYVCVAYIKIEDGKACVAITDNEDLW